MKIVIPNLTIKLASVALIFTYSSIHAQEDIADSGQEVEEITVTGSQIKGAKITGSLPVSVLDFTDISGFYRHRYSWSGWWRRTA